MARRILATLVALGLLATPAGAAEPKLRTPAKTLAAAYHCPVPITGNKTPIMLVTGTGYTGGEAYAIGKGGFDTLGSPVCYVDFPFRTTADIQDSVEYLVYGIRRMEKKSRRKIAIFGVSQGGLLPRWALTYWPSLRKGVSDVIAVAGTQHGTTVGLKSCTKTAPCTPAVWQQKRGSHLLAAINSQRDETPGTVDWTTVRSETDEVVQPQTGANPTSSLEGASNILIQNVCPTRQVSHIGSALDSVTFAAFVDAVTHDGPAKTVRLPENVCQTPYAPGIGGPPAKAAADETQPAPLVTKEPPVRSYAKRIVK